MDGAHDALQSAPDETHLRFVDADLETVLPHEIGYFDPSTGALRGWVRIPTVTADTDTDFFLEVGGVAVRSGSANQPVGRRLGRRVAHGGRRLHRRGGHRGQLARTERRWYDNQRDPAAFVVWEAE